MFLIQNRRFFSMFATPHTVAGWLPEETAAPAFLTLPPLARDAAER